MDSMKIKFLILTICVLISCAKKTKNYDIAEISSILVARCIDQSGTLLKTSDLSDTYFNLHNIPKEYQAKFIEICGNLNADLNKLPEDYHESKPVRYFLLNKYLVQNKDTVKKDSLDSCYATEKNPYFMAFAILSQNFVDTQNIGNDTYIRSLARSFNVSSSHVYEGIWTCLSKSPEEIFIKVAGMIQSNLHDNRIGDPSFYFTNILLPYFTYLSNGYIFKPSVEDSIFKQFGKTFKEQNSENVMREFSFGFKDYLLGEALKVKLQNDLNSILANHHFRLFMRQRHCVGYEILSNCIPVNYDKIGKVSFVKKACISFSSSYIGLSTTDENDVVVSVDDIMDEAQEIETDIKQNTPLVSCSSFQSVWVQQNIGIGINKADSILFKLLQKEFDKKTAESISEMIIKQTAIHEVKHKWDEKNSTQEHWYNVDCEISAHLTCCALSDISYYSLIMAIMDLEDFYENIQEIEIRNNILVLLKECWLTAKSASEDSLNEKQIADKALNWYNEYLMIAGGKLPSIKQYSESIISRIDSGCSTSLNLNGK
jgi:hypothetical protein